MGDLDGDGRSARVDGQRNTPTERAAALRYICRHTTTQTEEDQILWLLDLHYKPQPETQEGEPR